MRMCRVGLVAALVCAVGALGCGALAGMTGYNEARIPVDAVAESAIHTDESWKTLAVNKPLGNVLARSNVQRRWASPNYGARDWLPALSGTGPMGDGDVFDGCKWVWYPERDLELGAVNSLPDNRKVAHMRRDFYILSAVGDIEEAYIDVMTSGNITVEVFCNGLPLNISVEGEQKLLAVYGAPAGMDAHRYAFRKHLVYGKNVVGIQATAHITNNIRGRQVPNYVRDGVIAKVAIR